MTSMTLCAAERTPLLALTERVEALRATAAPSSRTSALQPRHAISPVRRVVSWPPNDGSGSRSAARTGSRCRSVHLRGGGAHASPAFASVRAWPRCWARPRSAAAMVRDLFGVHFAGALTCDLGGRTAREGYRTCKSRAFLRDKFHCPQMVGVKKTLRTYSWAEKLHFEQGQRGAARGFLEGHEPSRRQVGYPAQAVCSRPTTFRARGLSSGGCGGRCCLGGGGGGC